MPTTDAAPSADPALTFQPHYRDGEDSARVVPTVAAAEDMLASWFERPVVLLSSGRTGLRIALQVLGMHRHEHRLRIPRFLSRCVINAVTLQAMPVESIEGATATLAYHQFGFPLSDVPAGDVIEDIAHAFFATAASGSRTWLGDFAIFSLPKFFPMAGLSGGVVTRSVEQANEIRQRAEASPLASPATREWMRSVYANCAGGAPDAAGQAYNWLDAAYELLYQHERADEESLAGLPQSLALLRSVGGARAERTRFFLDVFKDTHPPELWRAPVVAPYALPYFGRHGRAGLLRARSALLDEGVHTDVYHVDVRRSADVPEYRQCLLLPGHQEIALDRFEAMCRTVAANDLEAE